MPTVPYFWILVLVTVSVVSTDSSVVDFTDGTVSVWTFAPFAAFRDSVEAAAAAESESAS